MIEEIEGFDDEVEPSSLAKRKVLQGPKIDIDKARGVKSVSAKTEWS
jgi:hypothetical protein